MLRLSEITGQECGGHCIQVKLLLIGSRSECHPALGYLEGGEDEDGLESV